MLNGIDVSSYQGSNPSMSKQDIVFIKATESLGYISPDLKAQLNQARTLGKRVGFYHYGWPTAGAAGEVAFFHRVISPLLRPGDLVCLDWEFYGPSGVGVSGDLARAYKDEWLRIAASTFTGHRVVLYTNLDRWLNVDHNSNCGDGLWIADYASVKGRPRISHAWVGHQYTSIPLDKDVWNFPNLAAFDAWAKLDPKAPVLKVEPTSFHLPAPKPEIPTVHVGHLTYAFHRDPGMKAAKPGPFASEVKLVEQALAKTGWLDKRYVDGYYGTATVGNGSETGFGGIKGFQRKHSGATNPDGCLGPKELVLLFQMAKMNVHVVL